VDSRLGDASPVDIFAELCCTVLSVLYFELRLSRLATRILVMKLITCLKSEFYNCEADLDKLWNTNMVGKKDDRKLLWMNIYNTAFFLFNSSIFQ
jgi:hypothetical protein